MYVYKKTRFSTFYRIFLLVYMTLQTFLQSLPCSSLTHFLQNRKGRHGVDQEDCPATSGELKDAFIFTAFEKQYSFTIIMSICERSGPTLPTPSLLHTNGSRGCNPIQDIIVSSTETMSACHILCQSPDDTNLRIFAASAGMIPGREQ